jgi:hypothetical protein
VAPNGFTQILMFAAVFDVFVAIKDIKDCLVAV